MRGWRGASERKGPLVRGWRLPSTWPAPQVRGRDPKCVAAGRMALMRVFHGGHAAVSEPRIIVGRHTKDFGPGFYCTILRQQAERRARRYDTPVVSAYDVRLDDALDNLEFAEMTDGWLDFVAACRNGSAHGHDIVIGAMASDQVYNYVADCLDAVPSRWDIGKVHKRLVLAVAEWRGVDVVDALMEVYGSFIAGKIDDYNSSFYCENPSYIFESYRAGRPL